MTFYLWLCECFVAGPLQIVVATQKFPTRPTDARLSPGIATVNNSITFFGPIMGQMTGDEDALSTAVQDRVAESST
ncbi:hypothetical protein SAMN02745824_2523 [Parasphingorhabdus marina DSM 22363]|uniref:Uncharacterized protein n=1 Tax=Parasphingorhabdus marina DSM 22363 TaxID=1123272 RepID=A0A1N6FSJ8_9SPHN|nr:hypothetical protein SAMN02745824_2523 [Parasphingorhabdus marina DSM 22363]